MLFGRLFRFCMLRVKAGDYTTAQYKHCIRFVRFMFHSFYSYCTPFEMLFFFDLLSFRIVCVCVCYCHHCCRCCFSSSSPSSSSSSSSSLILFSSYFYYFTYEKLSLFETLSHRPYDIFNLEKERWHRRRRNECHTFHFSWRFLATHNRLHSANNARLNGWECTMWPKTIDSIAFRISLPNRWTESTQLGTDFHWFGHTLIEQTRDCSRIYVKVENPWVSLHLVRFHIFLNVAWEKNDTDYFFFFGNQRTYKMFPLSGDLRIHMTRIIWKWIEWENLIFF